MVVIEIFDEQEWKSPARKVVDQDGKRVFSSIFQGIYVWPAA